jgi:hypothetical protein
MINNTPDLTITAIRFLEAAPFTFYPCGSRWFEDATETSDFDFFIQDSPAVREWLDASKLFRKRGVPKYSDVNTICVYGVGSKKPGPVHVILVKSADARLDAQRVFSGRPKWQRKLTPEWNKVYAQVAPHLTEV